ncbi:MAG: hypothetical protein WD228_00975 [Mycobacterium sp.]
MRGGGAPRTAAIVLHVNGPAGAVRVHREGAATAESILAKVRRARTKLEQAVSQN